MTVRQLSPLDQIVLLAGLEDGTERNRIWALPPLQNHLDRLAAAGLIAVEQPPARGGQRRFAGLSDPDGLRAARSIRYGRLADLMAEHLPAPRDGSEAAGLD
jgi:hypothetical protein